MVNRRITMLTALSLLVGACRNEEPPVPDVVGVASHWQGFDGLFLASVTGDLDELPALARSLDGGSTADDPRIGGALGLLQVQPDRSEAVEAVVEAASACGDCHRSHSVTPPPPGPPGHRHVVDRVARGLVWGRWEPFERARLQPLAELPEPKSRAVALLGACAECHPTGRPAPP